MSRHQEISTKSIGAMVGICGQLAGLTRTDQTWGVWFKCLAEVIPHVPVLEGELNNLRHSAAELVKATSNEDQARWHGSVGARYRAYISSVAAERYEEFKRVAG